MPDHWGERTIHCLPLLGIMTGARGDRSNHWQRMVGKPPTRLTMTQFCAGIGCVRLKKGTCRHCGFQPRLCAPHWAQTKARGSHCLPLPVEDPLSNIAYSPPRLAFSPVPCHVGVGFEFFTRNHEMRPRRCRPLVEHCLGVRPRKAAKWRADLNSVALATVATMAEAVILPIPGMVTRRRLASLLRCQVVS